MNDFKIGPYKVGSKSPSFIIAEVGINHNGDVNLAIRMIERAAKMGVQAVKFQLRDLKSLYTKQILDNIEKADLATQHSLEFVKKTALSITDYKKIAKVCQKNNVLFMCTPWDVKSVDILEEIGVPAFKVASADLNNMFLLERLVATKKPLILSTGMAQPEDIDKTYEFLKKSKAKFALLHCNSSYPADFKDIHLRFMQSMMDKFDVPIGYSGHERGTAVSVAAVSLGAKIVERHYTFDRTMVGPDHVASLEPDEFEKMVKEIREVELALGKKEKIITQGIVINQQVLGKSLVAACDLKQGTVITRKHIAAKSPGTGLSVKFLDQLVGQKLTRPLTKDEQFIQADLGSTATKKQAFKFKLAWGVPARFHDFESVYEQFKPDFVEFHWSGNDVLETPWEKIPEKLPPFYVHVPETWPSNFLLNLCDYDSKSRKKSINYLKQTIELASKLNSRVTSKQPLNFIIHVGGFSIDSPISDSKQVSKLYQNLEKSLNDIKLDHPDVNLWVENMPPLPWLLGGQRFHNIMTKSSEIAEFCKSTNYRICLDFSHAWLECQYSGKDFFEYVAELLPYTDHLHISDARGTDGEGLVVGEGDVDFALLAATIDLKKNKHLSFIPEIWQGHHNGGETVVKSLSRLKEAGW